MRKKMMTALVAAGLLFSAAGYAQDEAMAGADAKTCDMPGMQQGEQKDHVGKMVKELGLTEDQAKKLKAHMEARKANRPDRTAMKAKHEQLQALMVDPNATKEQMTALSNEIADEMKKNMQARIESLSELKTILTPEQFAKFEAQKKAKHDEMKKRHGEGKGMNGGMKGMNHGEGEEEGPKP